MQLWSFIAILVFKLKGCGVRYGLVYSIEISILNYYKDMELNANKDAHLSTKRNIKKVFLNGDSFTKIAFRNQLCTLVYICLFLRQ